MVNFELRLDGRVVASGNIDKALLAQAFGSVAAAAGGGATPLARARFRSAPMTPAQASELWQALEPAHRAFLARLVEERGALTWGETKALFGLKSWDDYASGPGKAIERQVHRVLADKHTHLVWRVEHEWVGLEKGEDEVCRLHVDGPALEALAEAAKG